MDFVEKMRLICSTLVFLSLSFSAVSQEDPPKPKVSDQPLSTDQIAVYRAVLNEYLKGSEDGLNVANLTIPLYRSEEQCFKSIKSGDANIPPVVHRLEPTLITSSKILLVDPDRQESAIKQNDPQNLVKKAIDEHEEVADKQIEQSVRQAFELGVFSLSEIAFDKKHRRAVVSYRFHCGELCGNGGTLLLKKVGRDWKVTKRCGDWIS
jgi:hypothetical protein